MGSSGRAARTPVRCISDAAAWRSAAAFTKPRRLARCNDGVVTLRSTPNRGKIPSCLRSSGTSTIPAASACAGDAGE